MVSGGIKARYLISIIEARNKRSVSTFTVFIDFKKAYDYINRQNLWSRLHELGIKGNMLVAVKSLYSSVSAYVRVNSLTTDWFNVSGGLRQG